MNKHITAIKQRLDRIFRDTTGNYTDADKFKAMQEDTNLALISEKQEIKPAVNRNLREENPCISEAPCYIEPVSGRSAVSLNETENQALS